jgi:predicted nucleic-acid-binding Zn-ribbon protein
MRRKTTSEFIAEATLKHNSKYDYSDVKYLGANTKINILCPIHGKFTQIAGKHLKYGCNLCSGRSKKTTSQFIEEAIIKHDDKYDYSDVEYLNSRTKVNILCKKHGVFYQTPNMHLKGQGCPKCGTVRSASKNAKTTSDFIKKAISRHGNIYDYADTIYTVGHSKLDIICPIHGKFTTMAINHLQGSGCPSCANTGFDISKPAILYYIYDKLENLYKIGITNLTLKKRFSSKFIKDRIKIIMEKEIISGKQAYLEEQEILKRYSKYKHVNRSWPKNKGGYTEFFNKDILNLDKDRK